MINSNRDKLIIDIALEYIEEAVDKKVEYICAQFDVGNRHSTICIYYKVGEYVTNSVINYEAIYYKMHSYLRSYLINNKRIDRYYLSKNISPIDIFTNDGKKYKLICVLDINLDYSNLLLIDKSKLIRLYNVEYTIDYTKKNFNILNDL